MVYHFYMEITWQIGYTSPTLFKSFTLNSLGKIPTGQDEVSIDSFPVALEYDFQEITRSYVTEEDQDGNYSSEWTLDKNYPILYRNIINTNI